ncbi:MAG: DUF4226 domain-containing protein [Mycobacterium sp.]
MPAEELGAHADAARAREALLVQRLKVAVEADKIFVATVQDAQGRNLLARQRLDAVGVEIGQAVGRQDQLALDTPAGARQFQQFLAAKTRDVHKVVTDAAADSEAKAGLLRSLSGRYFVDEDADKPQASDIQMLSGPHSDDEKKWRWTDENLSRSGVVLPSCRRS